MKWNKLSINRQNIKTETKKAYLVKLPENSQYQGYVFWHPKKMVEATNFYNGYLMALSYPDSWEFKLKEDDSISYKELTLNGRELKQAFEYNENDYDFWSSSYYRKIEPKKIDKEVEVNTSLIR